MTFQLFRSIAHNNAVEGLETGEVVVFVSEKDKLVIWLSERVHQLFDGEGLVSREDFH